jgi:hypothetical protein
MSHTTPPEDPFDPTGARATKASAKLRDKAGCYRGLRR